MSCTQPTNKQEAQARPPVVLSVTVSDQDRLSAIKTKNVRFLCVSVSIVGEGKVKETKGAGTHGLLLNQIYIQL